MAPRIGFRHPGCFRHVSGVPAIANDIGLKIPEAGECSDADIGKAAACFTRANLEQREK